MCVGNVQNQRVILDHHVIYQLMNVLKFLVLHRESDDKDIIKLIIDIQEHALQLINIMLEETDSESATVIKVFECYTFAFFGIVTGCVKFS